MKSLYKNKLKYLYNLKLKHLGSRDVLMVITLDSIVVAAKYIKHR